MKSRRIGRRKGSRSKGYFFRAHRGWFTKEKGSFVPLVDEAGRRLKDEKLDADGAKLAYARHLANGKAKPAPAEPCATVLDVCGAYLAKAKEEAGKNKTFTDRAETLFDFCFGLPARFRGDDLTPKGKPTKADKVHPGYGGKLVLTPLDVDQWLQAHSAWKSPSTKRAHLKALIRALNYGVGAKMIPANPVRGYKVPKVRGRITYITPEQEAAILAASSPALATAIKVLIRTGMRPGIEFARITARHVKDDGERIQIVFPKEETKTKKHERVIFVIDPDTIATIRQQVRLHRSGAIFRTPRGAAWNQSNLSKRFRDVRDKLAKAGMEFDKDCVLYSTRHTYAKRVLEGYWTERPTNLQTLSRLMGNTVKICIDHYTRWDKSSHEFLWQSAKEIATMIILWQSFVGLVIVGVFAWLGILGFRSWQREGKPRLMPSTPTIILVAVFGFLLFAFVVGKSKQPTTPQERLDAEAREYIRQHNAQVDRDLHEMMVRARAEEIVRGS